MKKIIMSSFVMIAIIASLSVGNSYAQCPMSGGCGAGMKDKSSTESGSDSSGMKEDEQDPSVAQGQTGQSESPASSQTEASSSEGN